MPERIHIVVSSSDGFNRGVLITATAASAAINDSGIKNHFINQGQKRLAFDSESGRKLKASFGKSVLVVVRSFGFAGTCVAIAFSAPQNRSLDWSSAGSSVSDKESPSRMSLWTG